jgi:hypothetical protein
LDLEGGGLSRVSLDGFGEDVVEINVEGARYLAEV